MPQKVLVRTAVYMRTVLKKKEFYLSFTGSLTAAPDISNMVFVIKGMNGAPAEPLHAPREERDSAGAV